MTRVLVVMAVSSMLMLGAPQLAAEEAQRARSRGGGRVTAAPQSKSPTSRPARRATPARSGRATQPKSATGGNQRRPGTVQSGAPKSGRTGGGAVVGRARSKGRPETPRRGRVTTTDTPRAPRGRGRSVGVSKAQPAATTGGRQTDRGQAAGRARVRGTVDPPRAGRVNPNDISRATGRQQGNRRVTQVPDSTTGGRQAGRQQSSGSGRQAVRRPAGQSNVVGRAVPRQRRAPLVASPGYDVHGTRNGSVYRSNSRFGPGAGRYQRGRGNRRTNIHHRHIYYPGYSRPSLYGSFFYFPGYAFNLGVNYGYGYGPYRYGHSGYAYYPYSYGGYGYGGYGSSLADPYTGFLRLKIKPRDAQVYIDGYYVGIVDEFDGVFQRLRLEEGPHHVEIRHPAYLSLEFEVLIVVGEKVTYEDYLLRP